AARSAFDSFSQSSKEERLNLLDRVIAAYTERLDEIAETISKEMGAPMWLAKAAQAPAGMRHFSVTRKALEAFQFEQDIGKSHILREPVGVCALITPWNWPINQIACKVAPALAAGCTMVLKPSEVSPYSALLFAEVMDEAGVPPGVFNLVNGNGPEVGSALSTHLGVDMVSFTGSTRAGIEVALAAAPTVKRVAQELGGKSANVMLDDADLDTAVARDVFGLFVNSGQSCNAPSRMLVPASRMDEAAKIAREVAEGTRSVEVGPGTSRIVKVGDPRDSGTLLGPVVSETQYKKIQSLLETGISEGAKLECGGPGRPEHLQQGYYVKPTIFSNVKNDMTIAREEIFGPVLSIIGYEDEAHAVQIANDTNYGLSGYVTSGNPARAKEFARKMRTGTVHLNGSPVDQNAPFGGYKQSGNGREWGLFGIEEFLEVKSLLGYND
ncbi:MAG: aldehyde dehydrogenase family protein, partial [Proteobacteria bacterium]|nr:aldehyde dehydrogenase family protein [Pseudomonadota bacterium]